jgi:hypothetical protein
MVNWWKMRNLVIEAIYRLMDRSPIIYDIKPLEQISNKDLLAFYSKILIDVETEEYDDE